MLHSVSIMQTSEVCRSGFNRCRGVYFSPGTSVNMKTETTGMRKLAIILIPLPVGMRLHISLGNQSRISTRRLHLWTVPSRFAMTTVRDGIGWSGSEFPGSAAAIDSQNFSTRNVLIPKTCPWQLEYDPGSITSSLRLRLLLLIPARNLPAPPLSRPQNSVEEQSSIQSIPIFSNA
jgi:hypothetical protein